MGRNLRGYFLFTVLCSETVASNPLLFLVESGSAIVLTHYMQFVIIYFLFKIHVTEANDIR